MEKGDEEIVEVDYSQPEIIVEEADSQFGSNRKRKGYAEIAR